MILAMLFWGGGWTALKILTESVGVEVLTFWRFVIMFVSFFPILFFLKEPLKLPKKGIKYILGSAFLNIFFMFFAYLGVEHSTAGSGGVIITILSPLFTFVLSLFILKQTHSKLQYLGLFIGLVGGAIMLNLHNAQAFNTGEFYFILAAMTWAGITLLAQRSHLHLNTVHYSFYISVISMIALFFITLPYDTSIIFRQDTRFWIALLYLGIFGQTIATTIFMVASGRLGSAKASSFMFLVPLFALVVAYVVLGEAIKIHIVLGGAISLITVYFINKK
jgi:drug/metabolite transporter (DMT)-like permease